MWATLYLRPIWISTIKIEKYMLKSCAFSTVQDISQKINRVRTFSIFGGR